MYIYDENKNNCPVKLTYLKSKVLKLMQKEKIHTHTSKTTTS